MAVIDWHGQRRKKRIGTKETAEHANIPSRGEARIRGQPHPASPSWWSSDHLALADQPGAL